MSSLIQLRGRCLTGDKPLSEFLIGWFTDAYMRHFGELSIKENTWHVKKWNICRVSRESRVHAFNQFQNVSSRTRGKWYITLRTKSWFLNHIGSAVKQIPMLMMLPGNRKRCLFGTLTTLDCFYMTFVPYPKVKRPLLSALGGRASNILNEQKPELYIKCRYYLTILCLPMCLSVDIPWIYRP